MNYLKTEKDFAKSSRGNGRTAKPYRIGRSTWQSYYENLIRSTHRPSN